MAKMATPMETEDGTFDKFSSNSKEYLRASSSKFPNTEEQHECSLGIGSMVEVEVKGIKLYGVMKWIGTDERIGQEILVGLELEDDLNYDYRGCSDGTYIGRKYFDSKEGRAFFAKKKICKPDSRFLENKEPTGMRSSSSHSSIIYPHSTRSDKKLLSIEGHILPKSDNNTFYGRQKGIQGYHNSCYMDSTLFAMFSYAYVFDVALHRKKRSVDIVDYDTVQGILRRKIVNPLRTEGFTEHKSVMELRRYLDNSQLGNNMGGFMTEEKDPEEFIILLFDKVLNVEPFIKLRMIGSDYEEVSHLYQIFAEKDNRHMFPSVQYLLEYSFMSSDLQLAEIPPVMILQMPRFGQQKLYDRIRLRSKIDISQLLTFNRSKHECFICGEAAIGYCKECSCILSIDTVYTYFCKKCYSVFHKHPNRRKHKASEFKIFDKDDKHSKLNKNFTSHQPIFLELFAVVCIEKSHYVSFVKTGYNDESNWLFFDSMADRIGGEYGQNIPEVTIVNEVKNLLNIDGSNEILGLDKKKDEKVLRLFQDASICFYRYKDLSMYR